MLIRRTGSTVQAWYYSVTANTWTLKVSVSDTNYTSGNSGVQIIDNGYGGLPVLDDFGGTETTAPNPPQALPATPILDFFNRAAEDPLSQAGAWASTDPAGSASGTLEVSGVLGRNLDSTGTLRSYRTADYSGYTEAYFTIATMPGGGKALELLLDLNNVGSASWSGYRLYVVEGSPDQVYIDRIVSGTPTHIAGPVSRDINTGDMLLAERVGSTLELWHRHSNTGAWTKVATADNTSYTTGKIGAGIQNKTGAIENFGGGNITSDASLLQLYAPELHYDSLEDYRADSPAEMTDNFIPGGGYSNTLLNENNDVLAASDPSITTESSPTPLSLDLLGAYSPATETDRIVEAPNYVDDANRLHPDPKYGNKMYGRISTYNGLTVLQYWFFYYYNSKDFGLGFGLHQGDWEMVEVLLNEDGSRYAGAYAQHGYGEVCSWSQMETTLDDRPIVYVAEFSHASYFHQSPETGYTVYIDNWFPVGTDNADGAGEITTPAVADITDPPGWVSWPGSWGGDTSGNITSPHGPAHQGLKSDDPGAWAVTGILSGDLLTCGSNGRRITSRPFDGPAPIASTTIGVPPAPRVHAQIRAHRAVINYRFATFPAAASQRPWILVTSVISGDPRYGQYTVQHRIKSRSGKIVQKLGSGPGPYKLRVATLSRVGTRSKVLTLKLK